MQNPIKEAFHKVKEDINSIRLELANIVKEIQDIKRTLEQTDRPTDSQTQAVYIQTTKQDKPTVQSSSSNSFTLEGLKIENKPVSIGNDGVPTDRQTDRQTDRHTEKFVQTNEQASNITRLEKVTEVLNSLDTLKKDLRKQFKQLTNQEMIIFSIIYQLTDEGASVDYTVLANKTNLSESSMRDYVQKLIKKGVPIRKTKEHNKKVTLTIPEEFKRIASLETIISLRSL